MLLIWVITAPFAIYTEFFREQQYGLMNQSLGEWLNESALVTLINAVIIAILFIGIHAAIRRAPAGWWALATGITVAGLAVVITIGPVFLEPMLNTYTPIPAGPARDAVLSMLAAAFIILAGLGVVLTRLTNTLIRTQEIEADRFRLNAGRAPESFASVAMKLSQYRAERMGRDDFFDHPSGHSRVETAMRWKAEHLSQPDVR